MEDCNRYLFSKYPRTSLRVVSYKPAKHDFGDALRLAPSKAAVQEEDSVKKLKQKKKKKAKSCPNTPDIKIPENFMSEPNSPWKSSFPSSPLVEKAVQKLGKRKDFKNKKDKSQKLNSEVVRLMNVGKNKKQILAEILSQDLDGENDYDNNLKGKNKHLKMKRIKTAISGCMSAKKAESRTKEWREGRGFGQGAAKQQAQGAGAAFPR